MKHTTATIILVNFLYLFSLLLPSVRSNYKNAAGSTKAYLPRGSVETGGLNKVDFITLHAYDADHHAFVPTADDVLPPAWETAFPAMVSHVPFPHLSALYKTIIQTLEYLYDDGGICRCSKAPVIARTLFTFYVINGVCTRFPNKDEPIEYISFGAGRGGQSLVIALGLIALGYRVHLSTIDSVEPIISDYVGRFTRSEASPDEAALWSISPAPLASHHYHDVKTFLEANYSTPPYHKNICIDFCDPSWHAGTSLAGGAEFYQLLLHVTHQEPLVFTLMHLPIPTQEPRTPWPGICQFFPEPPFTLAKDTFSDDDF